MAEILLDPAIRLWVIIPIVLISLMFGLVRHYVTILLKSEKPVRLDNLKDSQALIRSRLLRENAGYIPEQSFLMRRHYFNNSETGYFKQERPSAPNALSAMGDPSMALDMMKSTFTNVLPMIAIGGWINWTFSGFLATKVPFPLTYRFKAMLQRGVELKSLSASWVSSMSWYFLNVFGLRSIYSLILGSDNSADQGKQMAMQMNMQQSAMGGGKQQPSQMFKVHIHRVSYKAC
ncbi:PREDICTED: ER membrane protein complex subunit 3-like [Amphimedon queenslandica]|uniref:ER membrane protein complex subunit 3 n=2 Tax=Amphimedon queenslandica TaxID=400682 RepID=A0AAN0IKA4_AMPQE|nr:PREDICTED: ER membrane protein complex subunit 3-like [Amphimedon queenslandica]|eukprot:XP_003391867.2 PREDICTED: ER membrane protein complex subunit 3-like [Amphimedon queenslandica]